MATNTGEGYRQGTIKDRTQVQDQSGHWNKRDRESGEFMNKKADDKPFKGVAKEPDERRHPED
ncbi:hypothetical protein [Notoacmeibacter ruber]|uniref:Uncharacterized protein n=1 Tax=Notoacmeibacter ruber TaxID=2670375 RepID=A0A3L7JDF5_9HYPH|nr:hypothetical protein [Notoacmeibacter ruber]RLQ88713.1 hypothetical protein D8780_11300 [Notoacmeibacter ruber]